MRLVSAQNHDSESLLKFSPTPELPALQYLDRVDKGSVADRAGLKPADFILEVGWILHLFHLIFIRLRNSASTQIVRFVLMQINIIRILF